jgi:UDP-N-acetylmuramate dehydrogenase
MTLCIRGGDITVDEDNQQIIADAGAWWDDVVEKAIDNNLWGIELMSKVPGSVGASVFINITAYGQSVGSVVEWIEVWDRESSTVKKLSKDMLQWDYKQSIFQADEGNKYIILRVCFQLSPEKTHDVSYQKALDIAEEKNLSLDNLQTRRDIIIEARRRAGSLWDPSDKEAHRTAGSFFKNVMVPPEKAAKIITYDESGKTQKEIRKMNAVHAGNEQKVSAAHVLLAAGFRRGQTWDNVRLHEDNLLKIEALPGANAQDVYEVMKHIQTTVHEKLDITLEPEVRLLGVFRD